jgi:membrane protease YdiL (CAAX protease family)
MDPPTPAAPLPAPDPLDSSSSAAAEPPAPRPEITCWRCERSTPHDRACAWCHAALEPPPGIPIGSQSDPAPRGIQPVLAAYAVMLLFSVLVAAIFGGGRSWFSSKDESSHSLFEFNAASLVVDALWLTLMIVVFRILPRPAPSPPQRTALRVTGFMLALPILAGLLWLNNGYHELLSNYLHLDWLTAQIELEPPSPAAIAIAILTICVEPGIVEEWFFRYLTLGHLRPGIGVHGAVVLSSVMFGLAHIHAPLSVPMLTLVGLGLGYVRVWSGSLILPMFLHALHNGAVLWLEMQAFQAD